MSNTASAPLPPSLGAPAEEKHSLAPPIPHTLAGQTVSTPANEWARETAFALGQGQGQHKLAAPTNPNELPTATSATTATPFIPAPAPTKPAFTHAESTGPQLPGAFPREDVPSPGESAAAASRAAQQTKEQAGLAAVHAREAAREAQPAVEQGKENAAGLAQQGQQTAAGLVEQARAYIPDMTTVNATVNQYIPASVAAYLPGSPNLNATSTVGHTATDLPSKTGETGVAILPDERDAASKDPYTVTAPPISAISGHESAAPGTTSGGVGVLPGPKAESGVAILPDERNSASKDPYAVTAPPVDSIARATTTAVGSTEHNVAPVDYNHESSSKTFGHESSQSRIPSPPHKVNSIARTHPLGKAGSVWQGVPLDEASQREFDETGLRTPPGLDSLGPAAPSKTEQVKEKVKDVLPGVSSSNTESHANETSTVDHNTSGSAVKNPISDPVSAAVLGGHKDSTPVHQGSTASRATTTGHGNQALPVGDTTTADPSTISYTDATHSSHTKDTTSHSTSSVSTTGSPSSPSSKKPKFMDKLKDKLHISKHD